MKAVLLGGVALAAVGSVMVAGAAAADLTVKAPAAYSWTGFYIGGNLGYGYGGGSTSFSGNPATEALIANGTIPSSLGGWGQSNSPLGGGQVGYNLQAGRFVYGIETDLDYGHVSSSLTTIVPLTFPLSPSTTTTAVQSLNYLGTVTGRAGFLPWAPLLLYADGGFAYGGASASSFLVSNNGAASGFSEKTALLTGWTAGGGLEYAFFADEPLWSRWSAKLEYGYYDLGKLSQTYNLTPAGFMTTSTAFKGHMFHAGLNYKF
ncbi:MAG: outer membrane protein [Xanthobacteraceae bacterium]